MIKSYMKDGKKYFEVYLHVRDRTGKLITRRKRGFTTEKTAKEHEFSLKVELSHIKKAAPIWTWAKWHSEALRRMRITCKRATVYNYEGRVTRWIPESWKDKPLASITQGDIIAIIERIKESPDKVSPKYFVALLRRLFQMAVEEKIIDVNPLATLRVKEAKNVQMVLNSKEAEILLEEARKVNHRFYPIWVMALKTGMRSGEMYALLWSDVDFESGLIKVTKQWTNKDGVTPTKTGENRVVPISSDLKAFLMEMSLARESVTDPVLPRLKEWTNGMQADVLRDFCEMVGITQVKFHDLRATFITNLLSQGVPLVKVMAIVGHRKMATTDRYLRLSGVDLQGQTEAMGFQIPSGKDAQVLQLVPNPKGR